MRLRFPCACALLILVLGLAATTSFATDGAPLLWKVQGETGHAYLFPGVEALPGEPDWFDGRLSAALADVDALVLELLPNAESQQEIQDFLRERAAFLGGTANLERSAGRNRWRRIGVIANELRLPQNFLQSLRPWFAWVTLTGFSARSAGYDVSANSDRVLLDRAPTGLGAVAIEPPVTVLRTLADLDNRDHLALIDQVLDRHADIKGHFERLHAAWLRGDAVALEALLLDDLRQQPRAYEALVRQRNTAWSVQLAERINAGQRLFVSTRAANMLGEDGLVAQLERAGFRVEPAAPR